MQSGLFNEDTVIELASVAKSEGWDQMVADAYRFVLNDCDWEDEDDRGNLVKVLISDVGRSLVKA
jgi:hypothetical protein